jgi:ribosome maturation factor RimP
MTTPAHAEAVRAVVAPVVGAAGLVLEDVEVSRAGARSVVRIVLDLHEDAVGGLDLDTIADVSRDISTALDAAPLPGAYTLEVSSPGASRPLTERRHFKRARGRLVTVTLRDGGTVAGRLTAVEDGDLVLEVPAQRRGVAPSELRVPTADAVRGQVEVELSRALALPRDDHGDDADAEADADEDEEG